MAESNPPAQEPAPATEAPAEGGEQAAAAQNQPNLVLDEVTGEMVSKK